MLSHAPLSPSEAARVQVLAQKIGRQNPEGLWIQAQALLSTDGQDVLALLMDKLQVRPFPADRAVDDRDAKVRLAAVYSRWLASLH